MQNVTAVVSAKGGTGKSTITSIISLFLAKKNKKVLMIDLNSGFRILDFVFGVRKNLLFDVSDIVTSKCKVLDAVLKCRENLFLLPAPLNVEQRLSESALSWIINIIKKDFDHIIIDCPSGAADDVLSAICIAKKVILIATADPICIKCSEILGTKINRINPYVKKRMIINKFFKEVFLRNGFFNDFDEIIDSAGIQLMGIVPEDEIIYCNYSKGLPFFEKSKAFFVFEQIGARFEKI